MNVNKILKWRFLLATLLTLSGIISLAVAQPQFIEPGQTVSGEISVDNAFQLFRFEGAPADIVGFIASSSGDLRLGLAIIDPSGNTIAQVIDRAEVGNVLLTDVQLTRAGTYFVNIFASGDSSSGTFELERIPNAGSRVTDDTGSEGQTTSPATPTPGPIATPQPSEPITESEPAEAAQRSPGQPSQILLPNGIEVVLEWNTDADMNLEVRDPVGNTLFFDSRTTDNGGSFGLDANGLCRETTTQPRETATWQGGFLPVGSYEILVFYRQSCDGSSAPVAFNVNVIVDGIAIDTVSGQLTPPVSDFESVFLSNFTIRDDATAAVNPGGVYAGLTSLPASANRILNSSIDVQFDTPVTATITNEQPFLSYRFNGEQGDAVTINLNAISGSLDTLVQLIDSTGNIVTANDDSFGTTNSTISNFRLPGRDTYTVVATRYGMEIGGTEGDFELAINSIPADVAASIPPDATEDALQPGDLLAAPSPNESVAPGSTFGQTQQQITSVPLPEGDVEVALTWNTNADLQLLTRDPIGDAVFDDQNQVNSGGILEFDGNVNCTQSPVQPPLSYIYWPIGLGRQGAHEVEVWYQDDCNDQRPVTFTLLIEVNGQLIYNTNQTPLPGQRFVVSFIIDALGNAVTKNNGGFVSGVETISADFSSLAAGAPVITDGQSVNGRIDFDNDFDVYIFDGLAGEIVTIEMNAITPPLDTNLFLLSPSFEQIAANDDAIVTAETPLTGRTTDSLINQVVLPQDGRYMIVATRFATIFGGTIGDYTLSMRKS